MRNLRKHSSLRFKQTSKWFNKYESPFQLFNQAFAFWKFDRKPSSSCE